MPFIPTGDLGNAAHRAIAEQRPEAILRIDIGAHGVPASSDTVDLHTGEERVWELGGSRRQEPSLDEVLTHERRHLLRAVLSFWVVLLSHIGKGQKTNTQENQKAPPYGREGLEFP
jgi:hypothetical protein